MRKRTQTFVFMLTIAALSLFMSRAALPRAIEYSRPPVLSDGTYGRVVGRGVQCVPYGSTAPSGPISYFARDVGKPGVPRLSPSERAMLRSIMQYVHSPLLRFAHVSHGRFIVYAIRMKPGICMDEAPGYLVLNRECNVTYEPGEDPSGTGNIPDCQGLPRRPWMPGR